MPKTFQLFNWLGMPFPLLLFRLQAERIKDSEVNNWYDSLWMCQLVRCFSVCSPNKTIEGQFKSPSEGTSAGHLILSNRHIENEWGASGGHVIKLRQICIVPMSGRVHSFCCCKCPLMSQPSICFAFPSKIPCTSTLSSVTMWQRYCKIVHENHNQSYMLKQWVHVHWQCFYNSIPPILLGYSCICNLSTFDLLICEYCTCLHGYSCLFQKKMAYKGQHSICRDLSPDIIRYVMGCSSLVGHWPKRQSSGVTLTITAPLITYIPWQPTCL